jgi:hypothetical protein
MAQIQIVPLLSPSKIYYGICFVAASRILKYFFLKFIFNINI